MKIKSVVAISALEAAIKRLGITLSAESLLSGSAIKQLGVSYSAKTLPISMAIDIGYFLIEADFFGSVDAYDGTGAIDEFMFDYFKNLTDDATVAENAVNAFNKVINDTPSVSHTEVFDFYKTLADVSTATDQYTATVGKHLTDTVSNIEDSAYAYVKKVKEDSVSTVEADYKEFHKALTEAPSLVDAIDTIAFFKNTQDAAGFTDGETLAFAKFLFDNVNATDDIDGAASILDDQEMQYYKSTTNIAEVTDYFFRLVAYIREYSDTAKVADSSTAAFGKDAVDSSVFTDSSSYALGTIEGSLAATIDEDFKAFNKALADAPNLVDEIDTISFFKNTQDSAGLTDAQTLSIATFLYDTVNTTDDVDGAASILDDQEMQYFKHGTDTASATDVFTRIVAYIREYSDTAKVTDSSVLTMGIVADNGTAISDSDEINFGKLYNENSTQVADTGSLRSQGYSDFTFFAEDYVGASRNF